MLRLEGAHHQVELVATTQDDTIPCAYDDEDSGYISITDTWQQATRTDNTMTSHYLDQVLGGLKTWQVGAQSKAMAHSQAVGRCLKLKSTLYI